MYFEHKYVNGRTIFIEYYHGLKINLTYDIDSFYIFN